MEFKVDGNSVYAYTGGKALDPAQPCVLFIHGADLDHSCWSGQSRWFAHHGHGVLAVDLPGHGRSGGKAYSSISEIAGWIVKLLDAAAIKRAALVGHSMGSLAALATAAIFQERVDRIALLGLALPMPVSEALLNAARHDEKRAQSMINIWSHSPRGQIGGNTAPGMWMLGCNRRLMEHAAAGVLFTDLSACNDYRSGLEHAALVSCPALILCGSHDQMTPPARNHLAQALPQAKQLILAGAGHAMMAEQPDAVLDALREFLGSS